MGYNHSAPKEYRSSTLENVSSEAPAYIKGSSIKQNQERQFLFLTTHPNLEQTSHVQ